MKFEYFKNTNDNNTSRSYSEIRDNNIRKLVPDIEITKLISFGYFDS